MFVSLENIIYCISYAANQCSADSVPGPGRESPTWDSGPHFTALVDTDKTSNTDSDLNKIITSDTDLKRAQTKMQ